MVNKTQAVADTIEKLLDEISAAGDSRVSKTAEELVRTLMEFYGNGLERIVELVDESSRTALAEDNLVGALLILHELHPQSTLERVTAALEKVRPYLGSHSGDVELLGIDEDAVVHLRLQGSCDGCPSSTVTVKLAIEGAIGKAAPEVAGVDVEGVAEPATPQGRTLLPISAASPGGSANGVHTATAEPEWVDVDASEGLVPGGMLSTVVAELPTLVSNVDGQFYAYRDRCASCGCSMAKGSLNGGLLSCPECLVRYDLRLAGRSVGTIEDGIHLDPLPLLNNDGHLQVAVQGQ
ncbi:MAG: NifU family protein [Sciscionella sp.]